MRRWRNTVSPPLPRSLVEWGEILQDPAWRQRLSYSGGAMTVHVVRAGNGQDASESVVFGNLEFIQSLRSDGWIHWRYVEDCTKRCKSLPASYYNDTSTQSQSAYREVLNTIKTQLAPNLTPTYIMCDFGKALRNVDSAVFPDAQIFGCYFHYCQVIGTKSPFIVCRSNNSEKARHGFICYILILITLIWILSLSLFFSLSLSLLMLVI